MTTKITKATKIETKREAIIRIPAETAFELKYKDGDGYYWTVLCQYDRGELTLEKDYFESIWNVELRRGIFGFETNDTLVFFAVLTTQYSQMPLKVNILNAVSGALNGLMINMANYSERTTIKT